LKRKRRDHLPDDATLVDYGGDDMKNYDELIAAYEVDVRFPDVSGMEHLDMLLTRSQIAQVKNHLTAQQLARLAAADRLLLQQAPRFYRAIQQIADLDVWRRDENIPPTHWWWYLDVLVQLPELPDMALVAAPA
jgi:hypothetical protein